MGRILELHPGYTFAHAGEIRCSGRACSRYMNVKVTGNTPATADRVFAAHQAEFPALEFDCRACEPRRMDRADLEEAVRLAADTERMAAADYRREIADLDATGADHLTAKGRLWVVAYDDLKAAQDAYEYDVGPDK